MLLGQDLHAVAPVGLRVLILLQPDHDMLALSIMLDLLAAANRVSGRVIFAVEVVATDEAVPRIAGLPGALILVADNVPPPEIAAALRNHSGRVGGWGRGAEVPGVEPSLISPGRTLVSDLALGLVEAEAGRDVRVRVQDHCLVRRMPGDPVPRPRIENPCIARIDSWITNHIALPFTATEMAAAANLSTRQMERLFRRHLGRSPAAHIEDRRLSHALRLLRETGLAVAEIARASGLVPATFRRKFRRRYGMAPERI